MFEIPFMLVPGHDGARVRSVEIGESKAVEFDLVDDCDGRAGDLVLRLVVLVSPDLDLRGDAPVVQGMGLPCVEQNCALPARP